MIKIEKSTSKTATCNSCGSIYAVKEILIGPEDKIKTVIRLCEYCRRVMLTRIVEDYKHE